jgi:hypothetical protein
MSGNKFFSCKYKYGAEDGHAEDNLGVPCQRAVDPMVRFCGEEAELSDGQGACGVEKRLQQHDPSAQEARQSLA